MTYLYGHKSEEIGKMQQALKDRGYTLDVDQGFGPKTLAVVIQFQKDNNLVPADGVVRQDMLDILFPQPAKINILALLPIILSLTEGNYNMNKDQVINLVTTALQIVSGFAIAKGLGDSELWLAVAAFATAVVTYIYTHNANKTA